MTRDNFCTRFRSKSPCRIRAWYCALRTSGRFVSKTPATLSILQLMRPLAMNMESSLHARTKLSKDKCEKRANETVAFRVLNHRQVPAAREHELSAVQTCLSKHPHMLPCQNASFPTATMMLHTAHSAASSLSLLTLCAALLLTSCMPYSMPQTVWGPHHAHQASCPLTCR